MSRKNNNDQWISIANSVLDSISNLAHNAANAFKDDEENFKKSVVDYNKIAEELAEQKVKWWKVVLKYIFGCISLIPAVALLSSGLFLSILPKIMLLSLSSVFFVSASILLTSAENNRKLKKLIKLYIPAIGMRPEASISYLASSLEKKAKAVKRDINILLREKVFSDVAYYDKKLNILVLDGYKEPDKETVKATSGMYDLDVWIKKIGNCILEINNIDVRQKLNILSDYLIKIKSYIIERPEKEKKLRTFVNYYLPTTIKLMESYISIEKLDADGDNINETKAKIEESLDMLASAYKNQLEALFLDEAMDISGDIDVLENMIKRDGFDK